MKELKSRGYLPIIHSPPDRGKLEATKHGKEGPLHPVAPFFSENQTHNSLNSQRLASSAWSVLSPRSAISAAFQHISILPSIILKT